MMYDVDDVCCIYYDVRVRVMCGDGAARVWCGVLST